MRTKLTFTLITTVLLAGLSLAQTPPTPPSPPTPPMAPVPPNPPLPPNRHPNMPKVPVTFLGVETSDVPRVVSEQLGLARGFGLVVDYVVPDSPAAAGGVQANDILKMLNDQILTEPDQLSKLIRSYPDGTTITLTVLRKGQEQKVTVKLGKKEVPQGRLWEHGSHMPGDFKMGDFDMGDLRDQMDDLKENVRDSTMDMIQGAVMKTHEEVARAREEALRAGQEARDNGQRARDNAQQARDYVQRARDAAQRVRDQVQRNAGQINITRTDDTGLRTTRIDMAKAQIVYCDDKGELRLDHNGGKRILTAKDPQGRLLFSGPIETPEELDKIPAEVRDRYNKLQQKDLPSFVSPTDKDDEDNAADQKEEESERPEVEQISVQSLPHSVWTIRTLLV